MDIECGVVTWGSVSAKGNASELFAKHPVEDVAFLDAPVGGVRVVVEGEQVLVPLRYSSYIEMF